MNHERLSVVCSDVIQEIKQSPQQRMSAEGMDPNSMEAPALFLATPCAVIFGI